MNALLLMLSQSNNLDQSPAIEASRRQGEHQEQGIHARKQGPRHAGRKTAHGMQLTYIGIKHQGFREFVSAIPSSKQDVVRAVPQLHHLLCTSIRSDSIVSALLHSIDTIEAQFLIAPLPLVVELSIENILHPQT